MFIIAEDDKPAVEALLTRYLRWWRARDRDIQVKEKLEARIAEYPAQFEQLKAAFALFGISGFKREDWDKLREALGEDAYDAACDKVPDRIPLPECEEWAAPPPTEKRTPLSEIFQQLLSGSVAKMQSAPEDASATVREIALQKLQEAGNGGIKAADVRKYIENLRGAPLHEKTVGMTLYRLSQEGFARREGRTWFFVPPPTEETKNPGGDTPGPISRDDEKGEDQ